MRKILELHDVQAAFRPIGKSRGNKESRVILAEEHSIEDVGELGDVDVCEQSVPMDRQIPTNNAQGRQVDKRQDRVEVEIQVLVHIAE
jgi:hypothetical protein